MKRVVLSTAMFALALAVGAAPNAAAQGKPLDANEAKQLLQRSEEHLEQARQASERGQSEQARQHLERYTDNLQQVNRALARGGVERDDTLEVAERVGQATLKHVSVLEGLLARTPERARPGLQRALQASLSGHDAATQAVLANARADVPAFLTLGEAHRAMEKNEALLKHTQRSQKHLEVLAGLRNNLPEQALPGLDRAITNSQRNSQAGLERAMDQFAANTDAVSRAIETGRVPDFQAAGVLDIVERNTRRHLGVLGDLRGRVPEQARANIERAIQVSERGNQAATAALRRTPGGGVQTGRPGSVGQPQGGPGGRPGSRPGGPPSDRPGPPR